MVILAVAVLGGCAPRAAAPLIERRDDHDGFTIRHPAGWIGFRKEQEGMLWLIPPGTDRVPPDVAEFILVVTRPSPGRLDDPAIRRAVFDVLPIHGVSGFQQDPRTTGRVLWYKFEVTGSSGGQEWASVGTVAAGQARYHVVVCAAPLARWRDEQTLCDQVVRTFQPGDLND